MVEKYLPIGSVVMLKFGHKKIMINGYACKDINSGDKIFDYSGSVYPEGILSFDKSIVFDHEQIEKIFFVGYVDDDEKNFMDKLRDGILELKKQVLEKDDFSNGETFNNTRNISTDSIDI